MYKLCFASVDGVATITTRDENGEMVFDGYGRPGVLVLGEPEVSPPETCEKAEECFEDMFYDLNGGGCTL